MLILRGPALASSIADLDIDDLPQPLTYINDVCSVRRIFVLFKLARIPTIEERD